MLGHVSGKGNQIISGSASKVISITVCFFCVIISYVLSRPIGIGNLFSISFNRSFTFLQYQFEFQLLEYHCSSTAVRRDSRHPYRPLSHPLSHVYSPLLSPPFVLRRLPSHRCLAERLALPRWRVGRTLRRTKG